MVKGSWKPRLKADLRSHFTLKLSLTVTQNRSRLTNKMRSNRSKMLDFIIRRFVTPHCECYINPQVGEASQCMVMSLTLFPFPDIVLLSPLTFLEASVSKLVKRIPPELAAPHSESYGNTLSRTSCVRSCSIEGSSSTSRTEFLAIIESQKLSSQDLIKGQFGEKG